LLLNGILPSIGTVGDAFDNAVADTTIGLCKHGAAGRPRSSDS
jgi:putative transposase